MRTAKRKIISKLWMIAMLMFLSMGSMWAVARAEDVLETESTQMSESESGGSETSESESGESETPESETESEKITESDTAKPDIPLVNTPATEPQTEAGPKVNPNISAEKVINIIYEKTNSGFSKEATVSGRQKRYKTKKNQNKILLAGSSSIRRWETAPSQFAPLKTINMGIGGSATKDWLKWYKKLIVPYHPKAIVLYVGANDFSGKTVKGKNVAQRCQKLLKKLMKELPKTPIYYVGVYPSIYRKAYQKQINDYNKRMKKFCHNYKNLHYIDISSGFYKNGKYQEDLLAEDGLHLSEKGYQLWNKAVVKKVKAGVKR